MLQFWLRGHPDHSPLKFWLNVYRRDLQGSSYFAPMQEFRETPKAHMRVSALDPNKYVKYYKAMH